MINLKAFINSLKLSWIRRLLQTTSKWQLILKNYVNIDLLVNCGNDYVQKCLKDCSNPFWVDVFKAWFHLNSLIEKNSLIDNSVLKSPLWFNENILIGHKTVFLKNFFDKKILIINDLISDHNTGRFYNFQEIIRIFKVKSNFLQYHSIVSAVKKFISSNEITKSKVTYPYIPINIEIFLRNRNGAKDVYDIFIKRNTEPTGKKKWNELFDLDDTAWAMIYKAPFTVTKNTKLQWLQYRINHHILTTNSFLFKSHLVISPLCTLCNSENETIQHVLWECGEVKNLLKSLRILLDALSIPFSFNKQSFIFGLISENLNNCKAENEILLIIKEYIYKMRCFHKSLTINGLICAVKQFYNLQKYIANGKGDLEKE
ncbi:uncharacterized protein [Argopecten irradians]|uniref:uncharacterized protein n=1 Tax=Argopecten irradians TaxID=31199 RepID=UPI003716E5F8